MNIELQNHLKNIKKSYLNLLQENIDNWYDDNYAHVLSSMEISISLIELALYEKRIIKEEEKLWFHNDYQLSFILLDKWNELLNDYNDLIKEFKKTEYWKN